MCDARTALLSKLFAVCSQHQKFFENVIKQRMPIIQTESLIARLISDKSLHLSMRSLTVNSVLGETRRSWFTGLKRCKWYASKYQISLYCHFSPIACYWILLQTFSLILHYPHALLYIQDIGKKVSKQLEFTIIGCSIPKYSYSMPTDFPLNPGLILIMQCFIPLVYDLDIPGLNSTLMRFQSSLSALSEISTNLFLILPSFNLASQSPLILFSIYLATSYLCFRFGLFLGYQSIFIFPSPLSIVKGFFVSDGATNGQQLFLLSRQPRACLGSIIC